MPDVLVIEDVQKDYADLEGPLKKHLGRRVKVDRYEYDPRSKPLNKEIDALLKHHAQELGLVVLDQELSQYLAEGERERAHISAEDIQSLCRDLGIPLIVYALDKPRVRFAHARWNESEVFIPKPKNAAEEAEAPRRMAEFYHGMSQVRGQVTKYLSGKDWKRRDVLDPVFLVELLSGPDEARTALEQYAWGHFEITAHVRPEQLSKATAKDMIRFYSTALGYWIANVVLPFPGALAHAPAMSSYLGIAPEELQAADVRKLLKAAEYKGPFGTENYWWVVAVDGIVGALMEKHMVETRADALAAQLRRRFKPAKCASGNHAGAGYFCVWTQMPVCEAHSVGDARTVPRCAALSRVDKRKFVKSGPWFVH